jgi:two-component system response regulator AtoC
MNKHRILVVDDDESTRSYLSRFLSSRGYEVNCLPSGEHVIARLAENGRPSVVLLDILMPGASGLEILAQMEKISQAVPVIVLSGVGQVSTVVEAMRLGAADYLLKPFEDEELELAIQNALRSYGLGEKAKRQLPRPASEFDFLTMNPRVQRVKEVAALVADTDVSVLITGESGVGKEVVAKFIHGHSKRKNEPLVKINCAALPADLLESELFGHERGAFTGAFRDKPGKFELAEGGTILLDEIAEMTSQLQAKLLHVLQDGEYTRLGGTSTLRANVRVLAATNKPLDAAVASGAFREDLFFRLAVIHIQVPPLRERLEDLPLLASHFLEKYRDQYGNHVPELPKEMMAALYRYHWPGNIRQLENAIRRFLILRDPDLVMADLKGPEAPKNAPACDTCSLRELSAMAADSAEKEVILRTLDETNWNRKEAARKLDICYKSLLKKLRRWGISGRSRQAVKSSSA